MAIEPHDEWEYEYDENETEDFFFTLDLTAHVADAIAKKQEAAKKDKPKEVPANGTNRTPGETTISEDDDNDADRENATQDGRAAEQGDPEQVQVLGLHTTRPMIKFDKRIYSCYWSTDIGTQVHVARAGEQPVVKRPGNVVDVVALSRTRLLGKPVSNRGREGAVALRA